MMRVTLLLCALVFIVVPVMTTAQSRNDVFVDKSGVMRWGGTREEVHGFGVNYTAPFAHAFRTAKRLNINLEKAIEDDVYHFTRLGL